jgi:hypothetical protein
VWIRQYGRDGCTNYIHNLAADHIVYCMRESGFFSKYSQQSHKAVNAMMTSFFVHRTQLGRFVSKSLKKKQEQAIGMLISASVDVVVWDWSQGL